MSITFPVVTGLGAAQKTRLLVEQKAYVIDFMPREKNYPGSSHSKQGKPNQGLVLNIDQPGRLL